MRLRKPLILQVNPDWLRMIDADEIPKHKKKAPKRKPFVVEAFSPNWDNGQWFEMKRYPSFARAEQAVKDMTKSHALIKWQFRIKPDHPR